MEGKTMDFAHIKKEYLEKGYVIVKNGMTTDICEGAFEELITAENTIRYEDRNGNLRRLEKIYDKGENLLKIHSIFLNILKQSFGEDYTIFKDKYNAKPPGGEGFFPHYDGVFDWIDADGKDRDGWYCYASKFINVLVAIDECTVENGCLEVAKEDKGVYKELYENLKKGSEKDGIISKEYEDRLDFEPILLKAGDLVLFSDNAVHRSAKNRSNKDRRTLYYTYNLASDGDKYQEYFDDKKNTQNKTSGTLSGEI